VHLVGFIIRIYHDARSSECQIVNFYIAPFKACFLQEAEQCLKEVTKIFVYDIPPVDDFRNKKLPKRKHYTLIKACCVSFYGHWGDAQLRSHNHKETVSSRVVVGPVHYTTPDPTAPCNLFRRKSYMYWQLHFMQIAVRIDYHLNSTWV